DVVLNAGDEDFSVPDTPRLRRTADRFDRLLDHIIAEHNLDLYLGKKIDDVFGSAVKLGMTLLPPKAFGLGDRNALQADLLERFFHLVELEWFDHRFDLLHPVSFPLACPSAPLELAAFPIAGSMPSMSRSGN